MKEVLIGNNIFLFLKKKTANTLVVFSHSLSDTHESDLAKKITQKLYNAGIAVALYDFSFTKKGGKPSGDLSREVNELDFVVSTVSKKIQPEKIVLIGKSLGGVVNAIYCSKNVSATILSVFIIGFPFKLGFPPRLELLKDQDPILPDYVSQYDNLFKSIKTQVFVIQGDSDDLGEIDECKDFFIKHNNCTLNIVENSTHGFTSPDNKNITHYDKCAELILDKINTYENKQK